MNIAILYPLMALLAGSITAFQPLINSQLNKHVDSALWAALVSFSVGALVLLCLALVTNQGKISAIETQGLKWWMFLGGLIGAFYVTTALFVVPHLGVALLVSLTTAGGLIASALLAHYGILADQPSPINMQKFIGMSLLAIGAFITLKA